jgi:hypothetical protein
MSCTFHFEPGITGVSEYPTGDGFSAAWAWLIAGVIAMTVKTDNKADFICNNKGRFIPGDRRT